MLSTRAKVAWGTAGIGTVALATHFATREPTLSSGETLTPGNTFYRAASFLRVRAEGSILICDSEELARTLEGKPGAKIQFVFSTTKGGEIGRATFDEVNRYRNPSDLQKKVSQFSGTVADWLPTQHTMSLHWDPRQTSLTFVSNRGDPSNREVGWLIPPVADNIHIKASIISPASSPTTVEAATFFLKPEMQPIRQANGGIGGLAFQGSDRIPWHYAQVFACAAALNNTSSFGKKWHIVPVNTNKWTVPLNFREGFDSHSGIVTFLAHDALDLGKPSRYFYEIGSVLASRASAPTSAKVLELRKAMGPVGFGALCKCAECQSYNRDPFDTQEETPPHHRRPLKNFLTSDFKVDDWLTWAQRNPGKGSESIAFSYALILSTLTHLDEEMRHSRSWTLSEVDGLSVQDLRTARKVLESRNLIKAIPGGKEVLGILIPNESNLNILKEYIDRNIRREERRGDFQ